MNKYVAFSVLIVVALACIVVFAQEAKKEKEVDPEVEMKASIERGKNLFMDPRLGTTEETCNSCHMKGGTIAGKLGDLEVGAFDNLKAKYPRYWPMAAKVMTLDQVVNFCITNPLKGEALVWNDQRLTDLVAYCASVKPVKEEKKKEEPVTTP